MVNKHTPKEDPHLLDVKRAASFLGVSTSTIRQWALANKVKAQKIGSRGDWRFTKEELSKMLWVGENKFAKTNGLLDIHDDGMQGGSSPNHIEHLNKDETLDSMPVLKAKITERAEQSLVESEEKYRTLFDTIDQGFIIVEVVQDAAGKVIDFHYQEVNSAYEQQTGLRNVAGKLASEITPHLESYWLEPFEHVVKTGKSTRIENYNEDTRKWYQAHYSRVGGVGSRLVGVVFDEITERKRAEANLAFLADVSADLVSLTSIDGVMNALGAKIGAHFRASICSFLEIDTERGIGIITHCWHTKDAVSLVGEYRIVDFGTEEQLATWRSGNPFVLRDAKSDERVNGEALAPYGIGSYLSIPIARDGEWRYLLSVYDRVARDWSEDEIALMRELTSRIWTRIERARAEEALRKSEERLRLATESSNIYWWEFNFKTNATFYSPNTEKVIGVTPGKTLEENQVWLHPDDREMPLCAFNEAVRGTGNFNYVVRSIAALPDIRWLQVSGKIIRDNQNEPLLAIGITQNITERKQTEEALLRAAAQKDEFMSIASHELKTPVTSVKAYAQVLEHLFRKNGDTDSADMAQKMNAQLDKLTSLITELLDATKLESGKLELKKEYFDINKLVEEIVEEMQRTTDNHKLKLELKHNKPVFADRERMGQVLTNLLSNAIKYSPHMKEIVIRSMTEGQNVTVSVQDFGSGIPKEEQQIIFERFHRVPGPAQETYPGLGLGLYISSEIIKRHNGRIWVESEEDKGATFYVSLPETTQK